MYAVSSLNPWRARGWRGGASCLSITSTWDGPNFSKVGAGATVMSKVGRFWVFGSDCGYFGACVGHEFSGVAEVAGIGFSFSRTSGWGHIQVSDGGHPDGYIL